MRSSSSVDTARLPDVDLARRVDWLIPVIPAELGLREGRVPACGTHEGRRIVTTKPAHISMIVHACTIGEAVVGRHEAGVCGRPEVADSGDQTGKKQPD